MALAAITVGLQAIGSLSGASEVTASPSCGAARIPNAPEAVHWSSINATQAVLTIGNEIVARLDFLERGIAMRAREHPGDALPDAPADAYSIDLATRELTRWTYSEVGGLNPATFVTAECESDAVALSVNEPVPAGRNHCVFDGASKY